MTSASNTSRQIAAAVLMTMLHPWVVAPLWAQAQGPADQMYGVFEYRDAAKKHLAAKNIAMAKDSCQKGTEMFNKLPQRIKTENTGFKAEFDITCAEVRKDDEFLSKKVEAVKNLTADRHLGRAESTLKEIETFNADPRFNQVAGGLATKQDEFNRALETARNNLRAGNKKQAHVGFKQAQHLNKDENLQGDIAATNGCYGACKAAIWTVVLAGGGAASYFGYKEYEKRKK